MYYSGRVRSVRCRGRLRVAGGLGGVVFARGDVCLRGICPGVSAWAVYPEQTAPPPDRILDKRL